MVAMAVVALLLFNGGKVDPPAQKRPEQPIAVLKNLRGSVEHRPREKKRWAAAARKMKLHHLDGLRTAAGAQARVAFVAGAHLDVDEHSEILIEVPGSGAASQRGPRVARLRRGTVRAVVRPGTPLRIVTADGKITEVAAGKNRIEIRARARAEGGLELAAFGGTARVTSGGRSMKLKTERVVDVIEGHLGRAVDLLPFPELDRPAVDQEVPPAVSLVWRAVSGASNYRVQVSTSTVFDDKLINELSSENRLDLPGLKAGTYVWRVSSVDGLGHEGEFGYARRFRVVAPAAVKTSAPELLLPREDAVVLVGKRPKPVTFRWTGDAANPFKLVIGKRRNLRRRVVARRRVEGNTATVTLRRTGVYYWGVFTIDESGKRVALHKRARRLMLRRHPPPGIKLPAIEWK
jgi:hypothetical protein